MDSDEIARDVPKMKKPYYLNKKHVIGYETNADGCV